MRPDDELPVRVVTVVASRWRYAAAVTLHGAISPSFSAPPFFMWRAATKDLPRRCVSVRLPQPPRPIDALCRCKIRQGLRAARSR
jgi:hypothetical protein